MSKVSEIAAYMNQNPTLLVGIDGSMDPRGTDPRNQDLSDRRVSAVRNALIQAGVPAYKIQAGARSLNVAWTKVQYLARGPSSKLFREGALPWSGITRVSSGP